MKSKSKIIKFYFLLSLILTFIVTVLRTVSLLTVYEKDIGYYVKGAILPYIQVGIMFCSIVFFLSAVITMKKHELPRVRPSISPLGTFASLLCGTVQICSAVLLFLYQRGPMDSATMIVLIGFILATVYFFYDALCPAEKKSMLSVIPAIGAVIALIAAIVRIHVDYTVPLNNPNKSMIFITFAAISLFMVQDLRFTVERPSPKLYFATSSISFLLSASLSIPGMIGHYTNTLSGANFLIYYMVAFAYAIYSFSRLLSYVKLALFNNDVDDITTEASTATSKDISN